MLPESDSQPWKPLVLAAAAWGPLNHAAWISFIQKKNHHILLLTPPTTYCTIRSKVTGESASLHFLINLCVAVSHGYFDKIRQNEKISAAETGKALVGPHSGQLQNARALRHFLLLTLSCGLFRFKLIHYILFGFLPRFTISR